MARLFAGSPDKLLSSSSPVTGPPFTISAWVIADVLGDDAVCTIGDASASDQSFSMRVSSGGAVRFRVDDGTASSATSTTTFSTGDLIHMAVVEETTSLRHAYLNGGGKGTSTSTRTPTGIDEVAIGQRGGSNPGKFFNGTIGPVAIHNAALTDLEIAILAAGRHPLRVRRDALASLLVLNGQSPEPDIMVFGADMVVTGTTVVEELRGLIGNHIVAPG